MPGDTVRMAADRGSYLYQLQRLATEFVMAVRVEDILAIARARVVQPFGGAGFAVCLADAGGVHVAGAASLPRDSLHDLEGTPLTGRSPVSDPMNGGRARIFPTSDHAEAAPAIGYLPFLQGGTAAGCCVLEFAQPNRSMPPPALTLLVLMLDKVGESFARAKPAAKRSARLRRGRT